MLKKVKQIVGLALALAIAVSAQGLTAFAASDVAAVSVPAERYAAVQKNAAEAIAAHARNMDVEFDITEYGLSRDDFSDTYDDVIYNNPLLFYIDSCTYQTVDGKATTITMHYTDTKERAAEKMAELERAATGALSCIQPNMSTVEKVVQIHNYLVLTCAYDTAKLEQGTLPIDAYTSYGALVTHKAVCQGYSLAFKLLMDRLGIPCVTVQSDSMNHMWNAVQIDGAWYHIDATWDDPTPDVLGQYGYNMLLVSDAKASSSKNKHSDWYGMPEAAYSTAMDNMDWKSFNADMRAKYLANTVITTDISSYSMPAGSTYTFKASAAPSQILLAQPEDDSVARVEFLYAQADGSYLFQITALKQGATAISVHSESGAKTKIALNVTGTAQQEVSSDAYICDTSATVDLQPGQSYHFKLTWTKGGTPVFPNASTGSGSFRVDLIKKVGNDAYYRVTAAENAVPGEETGVYIIPQGVSPSMQFRVRVAQAAAA